MIMIWEVDMYTWFMTEHFLYFSVLPVVIDILEPTIKEIVVMIN